MKHLKNITGLFSSVLFGLFCGLFGWRFGKDAGVEPQVGQGKILRGIAYRPCGKRPGKSDVVRWSSKQSRWWKGIFLPALAADTGYTVDYWETKLKLTIMPEAFAPVTTIVNGVVYCYIPSVSILPVEEMNLMIEGSVAKCRDWGFDWVTLPGKEKSV